MCKPKTLADFPQFFVATVRRGKTSAEGCTRFDLKGEFDRTVEGIETHWFWLLLDEKRSLCVTLQTLDNESRAAIVACVVDEEPRVAGQSLAYLSSRWRAYHVWMVLDPAWGWEKKQFRGADAFAQDYDATQTSIVDGREVRVWTKLEVTEGGKGATRHYPASDQSLPPSSERRLVVGGWDHEHCALCETHIDAGETGYCDPTGSWVCVKCFERYILRRDLAFVDEL
jgi:hypothetical protein